jgi:hypothetical protein
VAAAAAVVGQLTVVTVSAAAVQAAAVTVALSAGQPAGLEQGLRLFHPGSSPKAYLCPPSRVCPAFSWSARATCRRRLAREIKVL